MKTRFWIIISIAILSIIGIVIFDLSAMTFNFDQNNSQEQLPKVTFPHGTIKIDDVLLDIQIADTESRRIRGLMLQEQLSYNQGMLFVFDEPDIYSVWMPNMKFSLDIIWFDRDRNVVYIETDVEPCRAAENTDCPVVIPDVEASYILEVTSGFVEKFGITNDSKLSWIPHNFS